MFYSHFTILDWTKTLASIADGSLFLQDFDHFMAMPRSALSAISKARPLTCSPGQQCCGRVQRSEDMFEYLLGVPVSWLGETCDCATFNATYRRKSFDIG